MRTVRRHVTSTYFALTGCRHSELGRTLEFQVPTRFKTRVQFSSCDGNVRCSDGVVVGRVGVRLGGRGTLLSGPAQQHSLGRAGARLPGTLDPVPQPRHNRPERRRGPRVTVLANYKVLTTRKPPPPYIRGRADRTKNAVTPLVCM